MELTVRQTNAAQVASEVKGGGAAFDLADGKRLNIRYWAPGELDLLDVTVPKGKQWRVVIGVEVVETDA